ncbi:Gfo/Idh/MocA family oxidoreductase [Sedimentitalea todarodis]|uniref:Gfo/Idh/MocA family oxidoreductase n=1 Tax=Sedimentitalea todarodis TaxID=1631240 RepID=A0ABU3VHH0_9RHOB|nr:Gfo/Idh/MocA family oxidoreductase [Sedimentitalea todarodis]MDU9005627.1 Gfo/Idh/MocA family oxidoreductase [Sedimentitalea todarodis]
MTSEPIRLGVAGLGRAFVLMLPTFRADTRLRLTAAAAPRAASRTAFRGEFGGTTHADVGALCADPQVEAIYVATPHQMHADHVVAAAEAGKHVLVDKPLAVSLEDGARMVAACDRAGVHLIVGPSHSFDAPVQLARQIIASGEFGSLRMIQALNYTDFLYRPRRAEELRTDQGGGILFSQAVHQIDMVRLLAGGLGQRVSAMTGAWDAARPTEGAYSALLQFENGVFATLTYSGYAHFDSDIWMGNVGELGHDKDPAAYGTARRALSGADPASEATLKARRTYGGGESPAPPQHHEHFGPVIVACDRADLRLTPDGVEINGGTSRGFRAAPLHAAPRASVVDALWQALRHGQPPVQTGAWGLASLEVCHAILTSAATGQIVDLTRQIAAPTQKEEP